MTDLMTQIAERFAADTADHQMTVLHDDGLYRHLRFKSPRSSEYWFELATWPGCLAIRGDVGDGPVFARLPDMFEFFRRRDGRINPGYWAEKVTSGRDELYVYDPDVFDQRVKEAFVEAVRYSDAPRGLGKAVRAELLDHDDVCDERGAHRLVAEFEFKGFRFYDTWEWSFRDWEWSFLWYCHAIVWGIAQYDAHKDGVQAAAADPEPHMVRIGNVVVRSDAIVTHPEGQALVDRAAVAADRAEWDGVWADGAAAGLLNAAVKAPGTGEWCMVREYLKRRELELSAASRPGVGGAS